MSRQKKITSDKFFKSTHLIKRDVRLSGANMDESSGTLELEDAADDFMAMYVAGTSTTNTTLAWGIGTLTRRPDVMEKLLDEVLYLQCS